MPFNVLFLCTGNAARSIMAEAILNGAGAPGVMAYSAGSHPKGVVSGPALALLAGHGFGTAGLRSKSWNEFAAPGAPRLDLVITICDSVASEACPAWPGRPSSAHWSVPDPSAADPAAVERVLAEAYDQLRTRVAALVGEIAGDRGPI